jgi:branched-chain amino acid transport system permease protein
VLYREAGQFKTTYAEDMAIFPIRRTVRRSLILLAIAFIGVPLLANFHIWPFGSDYLLRAILPLPDPRAHRRYRRKHSCRLLRPDIARQRRGSWPSAPTPPLGDRRSYSACLAWLRDFDPAVARTVIHLLGGLTAAVAGTSLCSQSADQRASIWRSQHSLRNSFRLGVPAGGVVRQLRAVRSVNAPTLDFFGLHVGTPIERYLLCLIFVTVFAVLAKNLVRGNLGRQWMAIRDMDIAAELIGIRPLYAKLGFRGLFIIISVAGALGRSSIWARGSRSRSRSTVRCSFCLW